MTREPNPKCLICETELVCMECDPRPVAQQVYADWRICTPFGRWETVVKVDQSTPYSPVVLWTKETGPEQPWVYPKDTRIDAHPPERTAYGNPVVKVMEEEGRRGAVIIAVATLDTDNTALIDHLTDRSAILVQALPADRGWQVTHTPRGRPAVIGCTSKTTARSQVHALAREYAKTFGVEVILPARGRGRK